MAKIKIKSKKKAVSKSQSMADQINEQHRLGHLSAETAIEHAIKCGELLIDQKHLVLRGEFLNWVEQNCEFAYNTAARYMKAARSKLHGVDFSTLSGLYGPSPPSESEPSPKPIRVSVRTIPQPAQEPLRVSVTLGKPTDASSEPPGITKFQSKVMRASQKIDEHQRNSPKAERPEVSAPVKSRSSPEYHIEQIQKHWKLLEFRYRPALLEWATDLEKHFDEARKHSPFNGVANKLVSQAVDRPGAAS